MKLRASCHRWCWSPHLILVAFGLFLDGCLCTTHHPHPAVIVTEETSHVTDSLTNEGKDPESDIPISDHRFFLQQIFNKYGHDGQMTFEGFEHLLENLRLGNVIIQDHDLTSHKEEHAFVDIHNTHEHSKAQNLALPSSSSGGSNRRNERAYGQGIDLPWPKHHQSLHEHQDDHESHAHPSDEQEEHDSRTADGSHDKRGSARIQTRKDDRHHHPHHDDGHGNHGESHSHREQYRHNQPARSDGSTYGRDSYEEELVQNITAMFHEHVEVSKGRRYPSVEHPCLSPSQILSIFGIDPRSNLTPISFIHVCPVIVYEMDQNHCLMEHGHDHDIGSVSSTQWLYSSLAVILISMCGLFSVAVIPIMQKWFYHTLLQFLVGLAVGSLSGDALLHLLPHAMLGEDKGHSHHGGSITAEVDAVWRGMTGLGGIYFFFVAERLLNALTVYRRQKREKVFRQAEETLQEKLEQKKEVVGGVGEKLSHYRRNSYGFKVGPDGKELVQMLPEQDDRSSRMGSRQSSVHEVAFHGRSSFSADPVSGALYIPASSESNPDGYMVTISDHHGHGHGHSHEVPQSVSAVAWMVIMGDGLHNFCDGMAIGAAFASGIAGGISTAVAVFCHELPHELGDFAMLLKTGMKVKTALMYNCLSSALCFMGMAMGVSLGGVHSATSWIFAATAGMFLYIALVDMLPELSTPNDDINATPSYTLAVQVLGISIGVSVMLLIAIYEHDLKNLIS